MTFTQERLEGRALEHELKGDGGSYVRMYDKQASKWVNVKSEAAKAARDYMKGRCEKLVEDLLQRGFLISPGSADLPVTLHKDDANEHGKQISVDVFLWCQARGEHALVEVKWGRKQNFKKVRESARTSLPKLKAASERGRWSRSDRRISAPLVGALAVTPRTWALELQSVEGSWTSVHKAEDPLPQSSAGSSKASGASGWVKWRKGAAPGDKPLWPSGQSGKRRRCS